MGKLKVGILISGRGSNMAALVDAARDPALSGRSVLRSLQQARRQGVGLRPRTRHPGGSRRPQGLRLQGRIRSGGHRRADGPMGVDFVCLAGFMRIVSPAFIERWHNRLINIHPSLLPSYKGLHTHERALADGVKLTGCTVHFVRAEMDVGPIVAQAAVPVLTGDTPDSLASRILTAEHRLYPLALRLIAEGKATVRGEVVDIAPDAIDETGRLFSAI